MSTETIDDIAREIAASVYAGERFGKEEFWALGARITKAHHAAVAAEREACLGILAAAIPSHDDARRDLDRRAQREQDSGDRLGAEMTSIAASKHSGAAAALHAAIRSIRARGEAPR